MIRDAVAAGGGLPSDLLDKDAMARSLLSGLPQFPALEAFHRQREMLNSPHNFLSAAAAAGLRTPPSLVSERNEKRGRIHFRGRFSNSLIVKLLLFPPSSADPASPAARRPRIPARDNVIHVAVVRRAASVAASDALIATKRRRQWQPGPEQLYFATELELRGTI